ncbi:MAG: ABC transporter ATP-binding protein [Candidimonas sp.]
MNMIELRNVSRRYGNVQALSTVNLSIKKGEFVTLLGPSGSGKTTLLNLVAGTVPPSTGQVLINGEDVTTKPPSERGLGMVFQNYALMPHMTVYENIAFPLRVRRLPSAEIKKKVRDVLDLVRLPGVADRKPKALSGGQQQRVSLARCIVYNPALILLDEPLGALDKKLREQMQLEIRRVHAELGITMLNVTHDQDEALTMSDRIILMNEGRIEQEASSEALYFQPETVFAADFVGSANLVDGTIRAREADMLTVETGLGALRLPAPQGLGSTATAVTILLRPESLTLSRESAGADPAHSATGVLEDSIMMGSTVRHHVRIAGDLLITVQEQNQRHRARVPRGSPVFIQWSPKDCLVLP